MEETIDVKKRKLDDDNAMDPQQRNGVRLRNACLTLEYRPDKPLLKSVGNKQTHQLAKLGLQRRDGHFVRIEAALHLAEQGAALVVDAQRRPLPIAHLYTLLAKEGISLLKYAVYTQLVRAGYVVRKPTASDTASGSVDASYYASDYPLKVFAFHFPRELLDQFPSIVVASDDRLVHHIQLPAIRALSESTTLLNNSNNEADQSESSSTSQLNIGTLNGPMSEYILTIGPSLLSSLRSQAHAPWTTCRPRWWPSFRALHALDSWRVYALRRASLLQRRSWKQPACVPNSPKRSEPAYDYDVFPDECAATKPIYNLLVVEQEQSFIEVHKLAAECGTRGTPLLIAAGTPTSVKISQFRAETEDTLQVPMDQN